MRVIRRLPVAQPITDAYESSIGGRGARKVWYRSQKEHLCGWFAEISGPGAYNRQSRNWDVKAAYNHFQCTAGLLWLAEALGEDPNTVREAVEAAQRAPRRGGSQCAAVRRVIPWERVEELLRHCDAGADPSSGREATCGELSSPRRRTSAGVSVKVRRR